MLIVLEDKFKSNLLFSRADNINDIIFTYHIKYINISILVNLYVYAFLTALIMIVRSLFYLDILNVSYNSPYSSISEIPINTLINLTNVFLVYLLIYLKQQILLMYIILIVLYLMKYMT